MQIEEFKKKNEQIFIKKSKQKFIEIIEFPSHRKE